MTTPPAESAGPPKHDFVLIEFIHGDFGLIDKIRFQRIASGQTETAVMARKSDLLRDDDAALGKLLRSHLERRFT